MIILGLNAYHGDSAACLVRDGQLVAAVEEERFRRIKHWAGLPTEAIRYCLAEASVSLADVDEIALNRNPSANLFKKITFSLSRMPSFGAIRDRLANAGKVRDIRSALTAGLGVPDEAIRARIHNIEHHRAHLASAFLISPFDEASVVSVDGFGDFVSAMWGTGRGTDIEIEDQVNFPHSLGLFYLALTQWLGFPHYGDEYKVMGLAPYGQPTEMNKMRRIVRLGQRGRFELDLEFFRHASEGVSMVWESGEPKIGRVFSEALEEFLGPPRDPSMPLEQNHKDVAASVQQMYEEAFFHLLDHVQEKTRLPYLALAGGCAMNSVANGKVYERTSFKKMYVQSAAGDAGGAIGAAFAVWNQELKNPRSFVMNDAYFGPGFDRAELKAALDARQSDLDAEACVVTECSDERALCDTTAGRIAAGAVVGWFQGRMEWGPRALGNRSIVCDPRRADMKEILNLKIKRRESFRPFAPSILRDAVPDWFETDDDVPFMLQVYPIRAEKRASIPAVTHVNGSGRLQTVTEAQNGRYYHLIQAFERLTGVPLVLNTSFNENEPVVCTPGEALDCFLRTKMDLLVLGDFVVARNTA